MGECIHLISILRSSPICVRLGSLFEDNQSLIEIDWQYDIDQLKNQIRDLQERLEISENHSNFEPDIHQSSKKVTSVVFEAFDRGSWCECE